MTDQDDLMSEFLPVYRGTCVNRKCSSSNNQRVLSVAELNRTYPATSELPYTPLPPQATHVCDRCGMVYAEHKQGFENRRVESPDGRIAIDVDEIDWEPDRVYDTDLRTAAMELVEAAPQGSEVDELVELIERWIPGFGKTEAEDVIEASSLDVSVHDLADFM